MSDKDKTVESGSAQADAANEEAIRRRNRAQMIGIMLVGFITLGGSYAVFYFAKTSGGWGTTNNGEFVTPSMTTQQLGWQVEGDPQKWWLWVITDRCDASCQATVKNLQAVHTLLNREMDRVRRGYTGAGIGAEPDWMQQFPHLAKVQITDRSAVKQGIYIVDPNGNLVLFYELSSPPKPILQDLKKLLKVSQIG